MNSAIVAGNLVVLLLSVAAASLSLPDDGSLPKPNAPFYQYYATQPDLACILLNVSATFTIKYLDTHKTNQTRHVDISPANAIAQPTLGNCSDDYVAASVYAQLEAEPTFNVNFAFVYGDDAPNNWTLPTVIATFQLNTITFPGLNPKYAGKTYSVGWIFIPPLYSSKKHTSYACDFDSNRNNEVLNECSTFFSIAPDAPEWKWARGFKLQLHSLQVQGNMTAQDANKFGPQGEECVCNFPFHTPTFLSF